MSNATKKRKPTAPPKLRGRRRLATLARLLENLPPERFDYVSWVAPDWAGKPDLSCGTTACALGWATTIPSLKNTLMMKREILFTTGQPTGHGYVSLRSHPPVSALNALDESIHAAAVAFHITHAEARFLFLPDEARLPYTASAKRVAQHIRDFLKNGMPEVRS